MVLETNAKRLGIYCCYDIQGKTDRYVVEMLKELRKYCAAVVVVCNPELTDEGRAAFDGIADEVRTAEIAGLGVSGYKAALECCGWERLEQYDELLLADSDIMGPVCSMEPMFREMESRDLDFWGIDLHHERPGDPEKIGVNDEIPQHIQTHFLAIRGEMLHSPEFKAYWRKIPKANGEVDIPKEAAFTVSFAEQGRTWAVYCNTEAQKKFCLDPLLLDPVRMLRDYKCPVFKRDSFICEFSTYLEVSFGSQARELMQYVKTRTPYDIGMIWENIIRTANMDLIKNALNLNYILPLSGDSSEKHSDKKLALVIHAYFEDLIDYCYDYALSMPDCSDIYITTNTEQKKKACEAKFSQGPWHSVKVILIENRGRDVSALLVGAAPYMDQYDYVCFMHDKKVGQMAQGIVGNQFSEKCFRNMLGSKAFVNNVLDLFESEPYLGMLCPPPPNHAEYFGTLGIEWGPNYDVTMELYNQLGLTCPISEAHVPVAPLGTMFWFRPKAMKRLLNYGWKYEDFPQEPNGFDGTMLHGVERVYPFVVQEEGYYSAWVLTDDFIRTEWNDLYYMIREINRLEIRVMSLRTHKDMVDSMVERNITGMTHTQLQLYKMQRSTAWRLGRILTYIPRQLKDMSVEYKAGGWAGVKKWFRGKVSRLGDTMENF